TFHSAKIPITCFSVPNEVVQGVGICHTGIHFKTRFHSAQQKKPAGTPCTHADLQHLLLYLLTLSFYPLKLNFIA
ncbi:MAG: hypothetical protein OEX02_20095, partial [Cyclobacteriaceae bacterium]|nr:hypothetical protein [Cyclobacteriaceae bacterium]